MTAARARGPRRRSRFMAALTAVCLTAGLALVGYNLWSIFGTDVVAHQEQATALRAFDQAAPPTAATVVPTWRTDFENLPVAQETTDGSAWATLWVPSWAGTQGVYGEDLTARIPIKSGPSKRALDTGAAWHYTGTQVPGEPGNFAVGGHRRTHGSNFSRLGELTVGDTVVVETPQAWYAYRVTKSLIILPGDGSVIWPVPGDREAVPTTQMLTMVTCTQPNGGPWGNTRRRVVHSELAGFLLRTDGTPAQVASLLGTTPAG